MIAIKGDMTDYAILKQAQQLVRAVPGSGPIVTLGQASDFSALGQTERLYLVAHGNYQTGDLRLVSRGQLLGWLTHETRGVPARFGGITILSCYSGITVAGSNQAPVASYLADGLTGRVAAGTEVAGANGYTFGSPEFAESGFCSVVPMSLSSLGGSDYIWADIKANQWLKHTPTHPEGVLAGKLDRVATDLTIGEQINQSLDTAKEYLKQFLTPAQDIEVLLSYLAKSVIAQGATIAERVDYMVTHEDDENVALWNKEIGAQYALFNNFYLWAPQNAAFTAFKVKQG
ncbi:hypothetical protein [Streptomyces sp. 900105245]